MAESTLSYKYSDLRTAIARHLKFPASGWSTDQETDIDNCLKRGLNQFYITPGWTWSFLDIEATIATTDGQSEDTLEDNYGSMIEGFSYSDTNQGVLQVQRVTTGDIRRRLALDDNEGAPLFYCLEVVNVTATTGQRWQVRWYPTPDTAYTMYYKYKALGEVIDSANEYPLGGAPHAETILASCLSIAEKENRSNETRMEQYYLQRLKASMDYDLGVKNGVKLGTLSANGLPSGVSESDLGRIYRGDDPVF